MTLFKKALEKYKSLYSEYQGNKGNYHFKIKKKYPRFYSAVLLCFGKSFNEKVFNTLNNISEVPFCKFCKEKTVSFKNINVGYKTYCSDLCAGKDPDFTAYKRSRMLEKHGVEHALQKKEFKEKVAETNLAKFGTRHNWESGSQSRQNAESTMYERYGVANPMENEGFRQKVSETLKMRDPEEIEKSIELRKQTNLEKYSDHNFNNFSKVQETIKNNFGVNFPGQIKSSDEWNSIEDKKLFLETMLPDFHPLKIAKDYKVAFSTVYKLISDFGLKGLIRRTFIGESEILDFLKKITESDIITNDRKVLVGKELDIYIPSKNIAIEFNGIYWHSELNGKDKNYHLKKTEQCSEKGIQLIHVFESEWLEKKEIVKSIISSKLGIFENRIYARNCKIGEVSPTDKNRFLEENHIQGKDNSSVKLGLFYNGELISIMTFGHSRYNRNYQYEMHRFCSKSGYQIVGGASKLWKYFLNTYNPSSVITYADRRYSNGEFYEKIGFERIGISKPNYFYFNGGYRLMSRVAFQKHKLKSLLTEFDESKTEWENMQMNGYDRIWDCGNFKFVWKNNINIF